MHYAPGEDGRRSVSMARGTWGSTTGFVLAAGIELRRLGKCSPSRVSTVPDGTSEILEQVLLIFDANRKSDQVIG